MANVNRNDNFNLINTLKVVAEQVFSIKDTIGFKKANVFFYSKIGDDDAVWTQILPTPNIRDFSQAIVMQSGGVVKQGDLLLTELPNNKFSQSDLETATIEGKEKKFYVVVPQNATETQAYTAINIRRNYIDFSVHIRRSQDWGGQLPPPIEGQSGNG